jgi:L-ascorbate metabolism protein UlaG (beta-lactamase superfamily)
MGLCISSGFDIINSYPQKRSTYRSPLCFHAQQFVLYFCGKPNKSFQLNNTILAAVRKKFMIKNPGLPVIKTGWEGNPLDADGFYRNLSGKSERGLRDVLRWQFGNKPQKQEKKTDTYRHAVIDDSGFLNSKEDGITWLGHATFVIHIDGLRILTDPVLWNISALKRLTPLPCKPEDIRDVDIILLSHNHRDHADRRSLELVCSNNPNAPVFTGLQMTDLLQKWEIRNPIEEAGWYQQYLHDSMRITYLPSKHWNRRYLTDTNQMLWGSYMIEGRSRTIYFGADSGYDSHFTEIGQIFNNIDISILGCGAYKPAWFMSPSHTNPEEALQAFHDLGAKTFIPMHIGTFDLSDEPVGEPFRMLKQFEAEQKIKGELKILDIGAKFDL